MLAIPNFSELLMGHIKDVNEKIIVCSFPESFEKILGRKIAKGVPSKLVFLVPKELYL